MLASPSTASDREASHLDASRPLPEPLAIKQLLRGTIVCGEGRRDAGLQCGRRAGVRRSTFLPGPQSFDRPFHGTFKCFLAHEPDANLTNFQVVSPRSQSGSGERRCWGLIDDGLVWGASTSLTHQAA